MPSPDRLLTSLFGRVNRVVRPLARAGVVSPLPVGAGIVLLETTGRKTGLPREVPLLGVRVGRRVTVTTSRSNSQWIRNLEADASPAVWFGGRRHEARADVRRGPVNVASLVAVD